VPGGVALSKEGRAFLIEQLNQRLDRGLRYPVQGQPRKSRNIKQRDVIRHEAHALANRLLGRGDIPAVVETRELWCEEAVVSAEPEEEDSEEGE
jgi:hypothetical protein